MSGEEQTGFEVWWVLSDSGLRMATNEEVADAKEQYDMQGVRYTRKISPFDEFGCHALARAAMELAQEDE